MIWKIENIKDSKQPIDKKVLKNTMEMVMSLKPGKRVSRETCLKIIKLINSAETAQRQGQNRSARKMLREAFSLLSGMNCKRSSQPDKNAHTTLKSKSWAENHLEKTFSKYMR